jgi:hypothetical protein
MYGKCPSTFLSLQSCVSDAFQDQLFVRTNILEASMTALSIAALLSGAETQADSHALKTIARFCSLGLIVSLCLLTFGMDLSIGWH